MRGAFFVGKFSITLATFIVILTPVRCESHDAIERIGDAGEIVLPSSALLVTWIEDDQEGFEQLVKAYALQTGTVNVLKYGIDRRRPDGGGNAFPSGHAASAFLGAAFLHRRYGLRYGVPAYLAATFVGWSRVHAKRHRTTDVMAGAAVGIGANLLLARRRGAVRVRGVVDSNAVACMLSIRW